MASHYVIDIGHNDDLQTVIRKCNENFKAIMSQQFKQSQINAMDLASTLDGYCPLDSNGKIDEQYLPSYVDDVIEADIDPNETPYSSTWLIDHDSQETIVPESGKIYIVDSSNEAYHWDGSVYSEVGPTISEHMIPFGAVDNTSTSTVMTATVPGITQLRDGVAAYITNGVVTSASGFTLNVNGLGALPVYSSMAAASRSTTIFNINYTMLFIYNSQRVAGGCWDVFYGYDSNTNTIGYQVRTNSMSLPMSSVVYRYRLLFTSADGTKFVPANNSSSTNATAARTVCQDPIDPFGDIVYYGTTASVAAGNRPGAAYLWRIYTLTLGYSFNRTGAALTLTSWKPVYIKCAPQNNGSAIIDSDNPFVQDLPTTEDGKIYIYLGIAYSATAVELTDNHPVYYYHNGSIRLWTDPKSFATVAMSGDHDDLVNNPVALTNAEIEALLT